MKQNVPATTVESLEQISGILKAMSNNQRLQILLVLSEQDSSLQELSDVTGLNQTQLANHLHKMRQLGMVDYTRFMRIIQYRITSDITRQLLRVLPSSLKE